MPAVQKFFIKQNDTRPALRCTLLDADELPVDLTAATIEFHMRVYPGGSTKMPKVMWNTAGVRVTWTRLIPLRLNLR